MKKTITLIIAALTLACQSISAQTDPIYHSTKAYCQKALDASDQYKDAMRNLLATPTVKNAANAAYREQASTGKKFKFLYARDLSRCMERMGHDVEFLNNAEGLPLIMLFFHDQDGVDNQQRLSFDLLARTKTFLQSEQQWMAEILKKNNLLLPDKNALCVGNMLKNSERPDLCKDYYSALYNFCSFIANADGTVSDAESAWLNKLNNLAQQDYSKASSMLSSSSASSSSSDPYTRLEELIGLEEVKEKVRTLANTVKIQKMKEKRGLKTQPMSYHCVFLGNPGTGKTTVARILADIYKDLGVVKKGHLVETDRSGLIGSYVGQTAPKVNHVCDSALNGILFIDEAYAITQSSSGNDYGNEAIATLLKRMEDDRDRLVVILAGYSREMKQFLETNSGLKSRINNYITFADYTASELMQIFVQNIKKNDCILDKKAEAKARNYINDAVAHKDAYFGNARFVRNVVEKTLEEQANRLASLPGNISTEMLQRITEEDVEAAIRHMNAN